MDPSDLTVEVAETFRTELGAGLQAWLLPRLDPAHFKVDNARRIARTINAAHAQIYKKRRDGNVCPRCHSQFREAAAFNYAAFICVKCKDGQRGIAAKATAKCGECPECTGISEQQHSETRQSRRLAGLTQPQPRRPQLGVMERRRR